MGKRKLKSGKDTTTEKRVRFMLTPSKTKNKELDVQVSDPMESITTIKFQDFNGSINQTQISDSTNIKMEDVERPVRVRSSVKTIKVGKDPLAIHEISEPRPKGNSVESTGDDRGLVIMGGPTQPIIPSRTSTLKPMNFNKEPLNLRCEWLGCSFETHRLMLFMEHVVSHTPRIELCNSAIASDPLLVFLVCEWKTCPFKTAQNEDLQRHIYLHAYHTKLKCIGENTTKRSGLNVCNSDASTCNILPNLAENLMCAWGDCSDKFINIQLYYDHIRYHCEDNPGGNIVPGGIKCRWTGCSSTFTNIPKLRDHVRSHTQEKLLSCPVCGALFSNRTRYMDHCRRQTISDDQNYACSFCLKLFSSARLLRDHIRSHVNIYRCDHCDMSCSSPSALSSHMKYRHSDEKPFQCQACPYAAKSQCDLTRHAKHHSQVTYRCKEPECEYTAKSTTAVSHHFEKTHSGGSQRRYVCHVCNKRFLRGYYLTKHLTSAHGLQWPSGHSRFRYKLGEDSLYRLFTLRYESEDTDSSTPRDLYSQSVGSVDEHDEGEEEGMDNNAILQGETDAKTSQLVEPDDLFVEETPQLTYIIYPTNDPNIKL